MDRVILKRKRYLRRRLSVKRRIRSNTTRSRLCISRSNKNIYCQIIDDINQHTLVSASTLEKEFPEMNNRGNIQAAKILGKIIALRALQKGIDNVVFDRNGYLYHGKVKAFADAVRENGLKF